MPVIFQKHIDREDARRNPSVLYVFGDNVKRYGYGGLAMHLRKEPNAVGVCTKYSPDHYFGDHPMETEQQNRIIDDDMKVLFEHVKKGGVVIWPSRGIGTNLANLKVVAPDTFEYLQSKLAALLKIADLYSPNAD